MVWPFGNDKVQEEASEPSLPQRQMVRAELLAEETPSQMKAVLGDEYLSIEFHCPHPLLEKYSCHFKTPQEAEGEPVSVLFQEFSQIQEISIYANILTIYFQSPEFSWEEIAKEIGGRIKEFEGPWVFSTRFADVPSKEEITSKVNELLDTSIRPALAGHGGTLDLIKVVGNSLFFSMGGGCQGCSSADLTLKHGVSHAIREELPYIGMIFDETDHAAGSNPYFQ